MIRILVSFTPFMVCFFWLIVFALKYRKHSPAKRVFTWFLTICAILYFCHASFFTTGPNRPADCIWALCSLSVYPVYYLYIKALTRHPDKDRSQYLILLPGLAVFMFIVFCPGKASDYCRMILFLLQILFVCMSGIRMLNHFDRLVDSSYADTEEKKMGDMRTLLLAFVLTSVISALANCFGRSFFASDDRLLLVAALVFSVMLFALSYIGYTKDFSIQNLPDETVYDNAGKDCPTNETDLERLLDAIRKEEKLYLVNGLTITDVASRMGSCRTYVSNLINRTKGESFSDYINRLRIEEAKTILASSGDIKIITVIEHLGFSNEQSFYRNFKKFTGMTPSQWKRSL